MDVQFRYDILVEDILLVEVKSVTQMHPIFEAIILSYMKHLQTPKGILINFNVQNIVQQGQRVFVNDYFMDLPDS